VGVEQKKTLLYVKESQIFDENIMEDISHILNNGEVPELFSKDEKAKYIEEMENATLDKGGNKKNRAQIKI
jgi:hypothetical protein